MFNHDKDRGCPYCPKMEEDCIEGHTKSMGADANKRPKKCAAWRPLPLTNVVANEVKTIYACAVYEWPPFLGFELSGLMSQSRASVDKVANEVAKSTVIFVNALPDEAKERLSRGAPLPELPIRLAPMEIEHKS